MSNGQAAWLGLLRLISGLFGTIGLIWEDVPSILFAILLWMIANTVATNWMIIAFVQRFTDAGREHFASGTAGRGE